MGWWLRGKKTAPDAKKMAHRVYQGWHVPTCGDLPQPTPKKNRSKVTASRGWFWHILDEWTNFADFWRWGLLNLWQGFGVIHTEKFIKNPYICTLHVHNHFYNYDYSITQKLNACVDARWKHGSGS